MWNSRPPPFMENSILNFHFDYLNISLSDCSLIKGKNGLFVIQSVDSSHDHTWVLGNASALWQSLKHH